MTDKNQLIGGMVRFSEGSMQWCGTESEKAVTSVIQIMDLLMKDARRISSMSEDTLGAVREFRKTILQLQNKIEDNQLGQELSATQILIQELSRLTHEHEEVNELVQPIIQVLQFQDRITQNMENMRRMLHVWQETRKSVEVSGQFDKEERDAFGQALYRCTTMEEERQPLRQRFDNLASETHQITQEEGDDILF